MGASDRSFSHQTQVSAPIETNWESHGHIQTLVLMGVTVFGIFICYQLIAPFLSALAWALTLAVLFIPLQRWLESRLKRSSLAATVTVLIIGLSVIVPATLVGQALVLEAENGAKLIEMKVASGEWRRPMEARPRLAPLAVRIERHLNLPETVKSFTAWLSNTAGSIVRGSVYQAVGVCLTFYLLYYFLRDRSEALQSLRYLSPLSKKEMDRLFGRVSDTIHATIFGTLIVAFIQGLLGGLMFWWLDLSAPFLWGMVMALLAVVPVLGAFIVWIPAALYLALEGSWDKAIILTLWGIFVVGTIDNLLLPIVVGNRLKLHAVLAFISIVGGLMLFGPAGLILGPVAVTVTTELLEIWSRRTNKLKST